MTSTSSARYDLQPPSCLGIELVRRIVLGQLRGTITLEHDGGTRWTILFRQDVFAERI